jgi:hypothetical protein
MDWYLAYLGLGCSSSNQVGISKWGRLNQSYRSTGGMQWAGGRLCTVFESADHRLITHWLMEGIQVGKKVVYVSHMHMHHSALPMSCMFWGTMASINSDVLIVVA